MKANETSGAGAGLSKCTVGFGVALGVTSVASALLVVAKELSPNVMAWMKRLTGQHWVTHSVLAAGLFLILGVALGWANGGRGWRMCPSRLIAVLAGGIVIGGMIIAGFYLLGG